MRFATLNTAVSGMNAAQANLYVTGHNMANVHVPGFTRQQVVQADHFSQSAGRNHTGLMQVGLGANVQTIRQLRDRFLDAAFRQSASVVAFHNVNYVAGRNVESVIGEMDGEHRLQDVLRDLNNYIHELHNNIPGVETRGEFISASISFVNKANNMANTLRRQQYNINDNIIQMTRRVNELIATINTYSQKVRTNEFTGDRANDFRDVVNRALDELSGYLDMTYSIGENFNVSIFSEGHALLVNNHQTLLGLRYATPNTNFVEVVISRYEGIHQYQENLRTFFNYGRDIDPRRGNDRGALKGLMAARGFNHYTHADSPALLAERHRRNVERLVANIGPPPAAIPPDVNTPFTDPADYWRDELRIERLAYQRDTWSMNNSVIAQTQVQIDTLVNRIVLLINDTLAPRVNVGGNMYEAVPLEDRPFGQDGSQYFMPIFVRRGEDYRGDRDTGRMPGEDIMAETGQHWRDSLFTMGNFIVNPVLRSQAGYKYMTLSISGDAEDQRLLAELLRGWDSRLVGVDDAERLPIDEFYNRMVGSLSIEVQRFRSTSEDEHDVLMVTENARLSMKGVALDEEMANMLRFQHAFHGASRIFNYVDSMIDTLINRTGRVGL